MTTFNFEQALNDLFSSLVPSVVCIFRLWWGKDARLKLGPLPVWLVLYQYLAV
ncbi:MAG: hypothetical protein KAH18_09120 [Psychromonas sp.]|nr:hypothetical protein [Psychromonas sp.]